MLEHTIELYPIILFFCDLTLIKGHKVKSVDSVFSDTFQLIRIKPNVVLEQFELNSLISFSEVILGEITAFIMTTSKSFTTGLHWNVYDQIQFKLSMMVDSMIPFILILVYVALTLIQIHRVAREQKLLHQFFHKVLDWFK